MTNEVLLNNHFYLKVPHLIKEKQNDLVPYGIVIKFVILLPPLKHRPTRFMSMAGIPPYSIAR